MHLDYIDEFREPLLVKRWARLIAERAREPCTIMEICGGQTHNILRFGLDTLLPSSIRLIHGPGCPVCVTPTAMIDAAVALARIPGTIVCSFGDMLRVPGSRESLSSARAEGGDVRVVYSPIEALQIARTEARRKVVFFAVGFETTAPANAAVIAEAARLGLTNFSVLVAHVLVPPAMAAILSAPHCEVQAFLAAGHVCTITGSHDYQRLASRYQVPIVITGFEPVDVLQGIYLCLEQLRSRKFEVMNQYERSVRRNGNEAAQRLVEEVFEVRDREWRGIGVIPRSGLGLSPAFAPFDALKTFEIALAPPADTQECRAGDVLQGLIKPPECPAFGKRCRPESPLGAPMVSSEGACAAYYLFKRKNDGEI